ncbi:FAD-binding protein [Kitasatospora sp. NPDC056783]|uniref:FAD-binding oxidoreductase n=1 Tax=Kitasatospora sp. NPDC056783 TaxID=3345943 RepID=UPI00369A3CFD
MTHVSRRRFLSKSAVTGGSLAGLALVPAAARTAIADTPSTPDPTASTIAPTAPGGTFGPITVASGDRRYPDLVWGHNLRWVGTPDEIRVVGNADQVLQAVQDYVRAGKRIAVRAGGHCYEDFVTDSGVRAVIDVSLMKDVFYDPQYRAFVIEPGALLGDVYTKLYKGWGVTIPGGTCPTVGAGGHIVGGGYGALSRKHGLTVDHLYGIEVVVVDARGRARKIVATREASDPNRDLWWAHTGGGGGNFGIITKYLMRSPGAKGSDPTTLLPQPPSQVILSSVSWSWSGMTEAAFTRLLRNFGQWCADNSSATSPYASLFAQLKPTHRSAGRFTMSTQIDAGLANAGTLLDDFLAAVNAGTGIDYSVDDRRLVSWQHAVTLWPGFTAPDTSARFKAKSAYLRRGFPDDQIAAFWKNLTRTDYNGPMSVVMLTTFGGRINTVGGSDTVVAQRDSVQKLHYITFWYDQADDQAHLDWIREFYRDVYAATGGVPVSNDVTDGCFIGYADVDLNSPQWNTSGAPWHTLYYKDGYPRLQRVKAAYDPLNIFHHDQSIRLPSSS